MVSKDGMRGVAEPPHIVRVGRPYTRVILIVLDSVGVGALPDAAAYGDEGCDTLGHVSQVRPLYVPTLQALGLGAIAPLSGVPPVPVPGAAYGRMAESSAGKDSVTGHWELMGVVLSQPFPVFPSGFPDAAIRLLERRIGRTVLGNRAASGTAIIQELGVEHLRTGAPIVYTSADSVCQIAAHEDIVPCDLLYGWCETAYDIMCAGLGIGRIIARPFVGDAGRFTRTLRRRDFAKPPPGETLLDLMTAAGHLVVTIGKVDDMFAHRGIARAVHASDDDVVMDRLEDEVRDDSGGLIFANLVDFDTKYGHRNDPEGYGANLERFDVRLSEVLGMLLPTDLLLITADHGNDPTTKGTDHTREYVPLLATGARVRAGVHLGIRRSFADLGQTVAENFNVGPLPHGVSFLSEMASNGDESARERADRPGRS